MIGKATRKHPAYQAPQQMAVDNTTLSSLGQTPMLLPEQPMPVDNASLSALAQTPDIPRKPGFFDQGGAGRAIAGNIGDVLMQYAGMRPTYAPTMARRQDMLLEEQQRAEERRQSMQDWVEKQQWVRDNPPPKAPSEFDQALVAAGIDPNSDEGRKLYEMRARNMADPLRFVPGVDAQGNEVLRGVRSSGLFGGGSGPKVGEVEDGYKFKGGDPSDPANWEQVGGASPSSGSPTFPQ